MQKIWNIQNHHHHHLQLTSHQRPRFQVRTCRHLHATSFVGEYTESASQIYAGMRREKYFKILLGTSRYFKVLLGTSMYFWVLLGTFPDCLWLTLE